MVSHIQNSLILLTPTIDIQYYNYSFPYAFASAPEIAISIYLMIQAFMILKVGKAILYIFQLFPFNHIALLMLL